MRDALPRGEGRTAAAGTARRKMRLGGALAAALAAASIAAHALLPPPARAAGPAPTTLIVPPERHTLGIYRVTDLHLKLFTGPSNRFRNPQGLACARLARQEDPSKTSDDDELTVYGINADEPSIIYNDTMTSVTIWRGDLRGPRGIAADARGRVVVADTGNDRILILRNASGRLEVERSVGRAGSAPGEFRAPAGVALDTAGRIYVADTGNHRVQILDRTGRFVASIGAAAGGAGVLVSPTAIAVVDREEPWAFHPRDVVYVVDRGGSRIQAFSPDGDVEAAFEDTSAGGPRFAWIALDYYNNAWATDTHECAIWKLDEWLRPVASFGKRGSGPLEFDGPTGIAVWRRFGQVFIAERTGAQYYWVGTDVADFLITPRVIARGGTATIRYRLTERSIVDLTVEDESGRVLAALARGAYQTEEEHVATWGGADSTGAPAPPGLYRIHYSGTATYSSRKHFRREETRTVRIDGP